ncbi:MAG: 3-deoxy-D-manno-octulosonic acid transferase [Alphaproteobacteria bacterium]|nr:3-deoxy-D-manno-octulosonic acid transferase [Alphaproteobacteria bacterium]
MSESERTRRNRGVLGATYAALTTVARPLIELTLARRKALGREDPKRIGERKGRPGKARPQGALLWIHAASIGEALSVKRLIDSLLERYPALQILVTTGTVTSAQILADQLPERACHQYVPVDRPAWVRRFLDHWRPDAAFWVESEIWPNLVFETQARGIPMVLVNARMSSRSFARWQKMPGPIGRLLKGFCLVMAQNEGEASQLRALGADPVTAPGNLKYAAGPLPADREALDALTKAIGSRPVWLAASTHPGEEEIAAYAHQRLASTWPDLMTVIVPRHPARSEDIATKLRALGLTVTRRSQGTLPGAGTDIYIADTLGELGLFYRLAPVAFVGGSLIPHGGQNVLEPARLDCAIVHGPHMENFRVIAEEMLAKGAAFEVADAEELVKVVSRLLADETLRHQVAATAEAVARQRAEVLETVVSQLEPVLAGFAARAPERVGAPTVGGSADARP